MDNVVKEIKGVMKHRWGCDEGGATLAMAVRSEEATLELTQRSQQAPPWHSGIWGLCLCLLLSGSLS